MRKARRLEIRDLALVDSLMKHPKIYPWISDDFSPSVDEFTAFVPLSSPHVYYIMPEEKVLAIFTPINRCTYEQHTCVHPDKRRGTTEYGRMVLDYMFEETECEKVVTFIPRYNLPAVFAARAVGFVEEGLITKSFKKNGKLVDQRVYGYTKEKWICQQQQ